ncbi:MAG: dihydroorotase [Lautropia sp.]|nr:dihydroorotase [Lautropia sp.]
MQRGVIRSGRHAAGQPATLSIVGARLLDPWSGQDRVADVHVAGGRIVAVGSQPAGFSAERTLDAKGLVLMPGIVDLAARLREPGFEYRASLESEMHAAVAGGVTALVCPPDTDPALDEPGLVEMLKHRARNLGLAKLFPLGALTVGLKGERLTEMAELTEAGCVGFGQALSPILDTRSLQRAMQYAHSHGFTVWLNPVDPWLGRGGVMHAGPFASRLGLAGDPVASEVIAIHTIREVAATVGCRVHLCRISSAAGVSLVREAKAAGLPFTADVAVHHLHLTDVDVGFFDTRFRVQPPFRSQRDREALQKGLLDGTIDAVCSDHTPVDEDGKRVPFGEAEHGATALELLLPLTLKWAQGQQAGLMTVVERLTRIPAGIAGIDPARKDEPAGLAVGAQANLCLFNPDEFWRVSEDALWSQGKDTPYLGLEVQGRVRATVVEGRLVYEAHVA